MNLPDIEAPGATYVYRISDGIEGVRETLYFMRKIVKASRSNPVVIQTARGLVSGIQEKNWKAEINSVFNFVRDCIRYTLDPNEVETLTTPEMLLEIRQGDCDDKSMLLAALLQAIGHPTRFRAIGFRPQALEHVYVETKVGEEWIALDSTERAPAGQVAWNPSDVVESYIVNI